MVVPETLIRTGLFNSRMSRENARDNVQSLKGLSELYTELQGPENLRMTPRFQRIRRSSRAVTSMGQQVYGFVSMYEYNYFSQDLPAGSTWEMHPVEISETFRFPQEKTDENICYRRHDIRLLTK